MEFIKKYNILKTCDILILNRQVILDMPTINLVCYLTKFNNIYFVSN